MIMKKKKKNNGFYEKVLHEAPKPKSTWHPDPTGSLQQGLK